ncbi:hypothetical protein LSAT2_032715 [Lamellibrachia satsuma]|nr:hypothetical protein LSAT2_032715 [Lamellibrachia satsuma]
MEGEEDRGDVVDRRIMEGEEDRGDVVDRSIREGEEDRGDVVDRSIREGEEDRGDVVDRSIREGEEDRGDVVDRSIREGEEDRGDVVDRRIMEGDRGDVVDRSIREGEEDRGDVVDRRIMEGDRGDVVDRSIREEDLYCGYVFMETLLQKEFVFLHGQTKTEFERAVLTLNHSGALALEDNQVLVKQSINKYTTFFSQMFEPFLLGYWMFEPFLLGYWVLCQYFLSLPGDIQGKPLPRKPKNFTKEAQKVALRLLQENVIRHYEILSLDLLGNGLLALVEMGCMYKDKRADEPWVSPNRVAVTQLTEQIAKYVETPHVAMSTFTQEASRVSLPAKL